MTDISPMSRDEKLLRRALGQSIETEPPQSRIEFLLQEIIDGGGIGTGSYKIKDQYATLAELEAAHPVGADGDAYLVGDPTHIYVWLDDRQEYADGGLFAAVPGLDGVGITSIEKTATAGLVDTYTITYTDGDTDTFTVTNGAQGEPGEDGENGVGITSIAKSSTVGNVDTYTITLTDGSTYNFTVTNGEGVGVPEGGTTGQVLVKKSNTDYDTEWANAGAGEGVPAGGTTGQILAKKTGADYDTEWVNNEGGSDVTSEIESLSAAASELASETGSLSAVISTQTSEIASQTSEINSLASENSSQTSELSSLSQSMSELASAAASQSTSQSQIDSTQDVALASLSTENSTQTSELGSLSQSMSEMASAASSTSTAQSEMDSTQNVSLASLTTENSAQTSEIGSLSTAESEMASELDVIGSEVADKQDALVEGPGIDIDSTTNEIKTETVIFTGTLQQWEALTTEQKLAYTHAAITNDSQSGVIDLVPMKDSLHAVSSGGVYDDTYIVGHHDDASWIEVSKDTSTTGKTTRMFIQDNNLRPFTQLFDSQGQQEDVDSVVIGRDLDWKFVDAKTGQAHIALPASFKEIWVRARKTDTIDALTWHIPGAVLTSTAVLYISGWATSAAVSYGYIYASKSEVYLGAYTNNNNDITSTALVDVYYR